MSGFVAVTGAGGLLGGAVVRAFAARGRAVRALYRPGGSAPTAGGVAVAVDVRDAAGMRAALKGADVVVHAAALMDAPESDVVSTNVAGTAATLDAAAEGGARRFVYVSSVAVYGDGDMLDVDESRPRRPGLAYGKSKAAAEDLVAAAADRGGLVATILRPCNLWGPGDRHFSALLLATARDGVTPLVRGGAVRYDLAAAADVAEACALAAERAVGPGVGVYHAHSDEGLTVGEIVRRVRATTGLPAKTADAPDPQIPPPGVPAWLLASLNQDRGFSVARIRRDLGFRPQAVFPQGLAG